jgi:MGT family glycosyltransferase
MTAASRFVFVVWDGGGNVPPTLHIGRALTNRGHRVRVLGSPALEHQVRDSGCEFRPFARARDRDASAGRAFEDMPMMLVGELFLGSSVARDLLDELEREPAAVLVVDYMLAGGLAGAERSGVPAVGLVHTLYSGFVDLLAEQMDAGLFLLNDTRESLGLAPLESARQQLLDRSLVMVTTARAFDGPTGPLPGNLRYVGPQLDAATPGVGEPLPWPTDDPTPLVLVSLSTTYQHQEIVLERIVDGLADAPVHVLVTLGHELSTAEAPSPPPNTVIRPWSPHTAVLPRAAAVATHAGHGTVIAALAYGVPLVCIPMGRDQGVNAERVKECGAGIVLDPDAGPPAIADALSEVLATPGYRAAARRMADEIRTEQADNPSAVDELERLLR